MARGANPVRQADPVKIEGSHEEGAEFRIVAKPVFRRRQRLAGASVTGLEMNVTS